MLKYSRENKNKNMKENRLIYNVPSNENRVNLGRLEPGTLPVAFDDAAKGEKGGGKTEVVDKGEKNKEAKEKQDEQYEAKIKANQDKAKFWRGQPDSNGEFKEVYKQEEEQKIALLDKLKDPKITNPDNADTAANEQKKIEEAKKQKTTPGESPNSAIG